MKKIAESVLCSLDRGEKDLRSKIVLNSGDIEIYYKSLVDGQLYGGITYRISLEEGLTAGEIRQIMASHFAETGTEIKAEPASAGETYYGIQIMGLARKLSSRDSAFKGLEARGVKAAGSNVYKYVCGRYATRQEASQHLQSVRRKFPDAFIVKVTGDKVERVK